MGAREWRYGEAGAVGGGGAEMTDGEARAADGRRGGRWGRGGGWGAGALAGRCAIIPRRRVRAMADGAGLNAESEGVRAHLVIMQGVITRMAENSRSCKVWCITLVSATLVLVARTGEPRHALLALVPTLLFLILDAYYLALERSFRESYNAFVKKLHKSELEKCELYAVKSCGKVWRRFGGCLVSFSIWPFYLLLGLTIVLAWLVVLPSDTILG